MLNFIFNLATHKACVGEDLNENLFGNLKTTGQLVDLGVDGKKQAAWLRIIGSGDADCFKHSNEISRLIKVG